MGGRSSTVALILLVLGLLGVSLCTSSAPTEVITLNDASFEHQTQASTGQTTGSWCVLFTASKASDAHKEAVALWSELAADEEKEVIYAVVDLDTNKQLARRFKGIRVPSAVLLRDRAMYTYDIPNDDDSAEVIIGFVSGGYTQLPRQVVPSPSSGLLGASEADDEGSSSLSEAEIWKLKVAGALLAVALVWKLALYLTAGGKPPAAAEAPQEGRAEQPSTKKAEAKAVTEKNEKKQAEPSADTAAATKQDSKKKAEAAAAKTSAKPSKANSSEASTGAKKKVKL